MPNNVRFRGECQSVHEGAKLLRCQAKNLPPNPARSPLTSLALDSPGASLMQCYILLPCLHTHPIFSRPCLLPIVAFSLLTLLESPHPIFSPCPVAPHTHAPKDSFCASDALPTVFECGNHDLPLLPGRQCLNQLLHRTRAVCVESHAA